MHFLDHRTCHHFKQEDGQQTNKALSCDMSVEWQVPRYFSKACCVDIWPVGPNPKLRDLFARGGEGRAVVWVLAAEKTTLCQRNKAFHACVKHLNYC